jgi:hypothetical protein
MTLLKNSRKNMGESNCFKQILSIPQGCSKHLPLWFFVPNYRMIWIFYVILFAIPLENLLASTPYVTHFAGIGMAESAPSLGTLGVRLSGGLTSLPRPDQEQTASGQQGLKQGENPLTQRLWIAKGLYLPINVGMILTQLPELGWLDVTSYVQGTFYEGLARPACALRMSYGKSFGVEKAQVSTAGIDLVISYGVFRYVSMFGVLGTRRLKMDLYGSSSSLESPDRSDEGSHLIRESTLQSLGEWGVQVAFIPAIAALTLSSSIADGQYMAHTAKVTLSI